MGKLCTRSEDKIFARIIALHVVALCFKTVMPSQLILKHRGSIKNSGKRVLPRKETVPKFLMTFFLVINHKFRISPYFRYFNTFPPISIFFTFPLLFKISPLFSANLRVFYTLCVFFVYPYFYHDVFMHHTLDAPAVCNT